MTLVALVVFPGVGGGWRDLDSRQQPTARRCPATSGRTTCDLLLLLRYGFEAGSPEGPLREAIPNDWILDDYNYPFVEGG